LPRDPDSDGFFCSEAGVAIVLQDEGTARAQGRRIHARVASYVNRYVPRFRTLDASGLALHYERCMRAALEQASCRPCDITLVQGAALGIPRSDYAEAMAIAALLGRGAFVTSVHGLAGNCLSAAGPLAVACAALQLEHGFAAPIVASQALLLQDEVRYVTGQAAPLAAGHCLVNCFDHLGAACSIVLQTAEAPT
jgi:3-oxoacyl-(acyl-carrier-protein) synthase